MFSKDASSLQSAGSGKKGKDVPLRKSDRRAIRQRVGYVLLPDDNSSDTTSSSSRRAAVADMLDVVFLQGTLQSRQVMTITNEKATLYLRSPSAAADIINNNNSSVSVWPYTDAMQVVWMEIDHGPQQRPSEIPTLALCSVLPPAFFLPNTTTTTATSLSTSSLGIVTISHHVSKFLCRGADLMRSGILAVHANKYSSSSSTSKRGQSPSPPLVVLVQVHGNPQPMAVGWLSWDPTAPTDIKNDNAYGSGVKGKGVHIITCYGDDVWKQQLPLMKSSPARTTSGLVSPLGGAPYNAGDYGNVGFCDGTHVVPIMEGGEASDSNEEEDEQCENGETSETPSLESGESPQPDQNAENDAAAIAAEAAATDGESPQPSPEEVLHEAVCKALVRLTPKQDLPMAVSVFYGQHVLPNRRDGSTIQLKQTRYKKFGPYLQEQAERGLLQVGPDAAKKDPLAMLTDVNRRHADLRPYLQEAKEEKSNEPTDKARMLDPDVVKAVNASSDQRKNTGFLTAKEMKAILDDYIARENLVHPVQRSKIVLDGPLTDALYKKLKGAQQQSEYPTEVSRKDLSTTWQAKMERAFALVQMPGSQILHMGRGKGPVVTFEVTKRQNKKFMTKIRGMEHFDVAASVLQHEIATRFACAVSIEENPTEKLKKGHAELVLQGNLVDEVEALLVGDESLTSHGGAKDSPFCIPQNAIDVILRKGVPARKGRASSGKKK
eukprot:scaffold12086_cov160-Amphora_coffeaeformis.AAC.7